METRTESFTRPWTRNSGPGVTLAMNFEPVTRYCRFGKHTFLTTARMATCCPDPKCKELQRAARKIQQAGKRVAK